MARPLISLREIKGRSPFISPGNNGDVHLYIPVAKGSFHLYIREINSGTTNNAPENIRWSRPFISGHIIGFALDLLDLAL